MRNYRSSSFHDDLGFDEFEGIITARGTPTNIIELEHVIDPPSDVATAKSPKLLPISLPESSITGPWLPKPLRDKLVQLYFHHVHPLCPVIDQHRFEKLYWCYSFPDFLQQFSNALFKSTIFAAMQYVDEVELKSHTGFQTVTRAQMTYYIIAKNAYRCELLQTSSDLAEPDYARICLLLSYWSPQHGALEINSLWIDRAIYHTKTALLTASPNPPQLNHDLKIIYWSCIVRNTLVSFFLRRPARLHQIQSKLFPADDILQSPNSVTQGTQSVVHSVHILIFIWTCKICEILNLALSSLERTTLSSNGITNGPNGYDATDAEERFRYQAFNVQSLELLQVQKFEADLVKMNADYNQVLENLSTRNIGVDNIDIKSTASYYMNQMITFSSLTTLYGFYFNRTPRKDVQEFNLNNIVLHKMVHYSEVVASLAQEVLQNLKPAHIPISILAWILLPATLGLVQRNGNESFKHASSLRQLPELLISRFQGARNINALLRDLDRMVTLITNRQRRTQDRNSGQGNGRPQTGNLDMEAKVDALRQSMKVLDLDLTQGHPSL